MIIAISIGVISQYNGGIQKQPTGEVTSLNRTISEIVSDLRSRTQETRELWKVISGHSMKIENLEYKNEKKVDTVKTSDIRYKKIKDDLKIEFVAHAQRFWM